MTMIDLHILLIIMIAGAVIAIETKDLLSTVVAVGAVGLVQALAFLVLKAPDLAIVQLVVEILSLVILLRATIGRGAAPQEGRRYFSMLVGLGLIVLILISIRPALAALPKFGSPIMNVAQNYIEKALPKTGAANIVSSIILDFRAYDTLGEAVVLFTAIVGAIAVLRKIGIKKEGSAE